MVDKLLKCTQLKEFRKSSRVQRLDYTPEELDEIEKHVQQVRRRITAGRHAVVQNARNKASQAADLVWNRWANVQGLAQAEALNPELSTRSWQHVMARDWAISTKGVAHLGEEFTKSGSVRQQLLRAQRYWKGSIGDAWAKLQVTETIQQTQKALETFRKKYRISKKEWVFVKQLAGEMSWQPYIARYNNLGEVGQRVLINSREQFLDKLRSLGFSSRDIEVFMETASKVPEKYHEVLEIAQKSGLNVSELEGMGFLPRVFSEDAQLRFSWVGLDDKGLQYKLSDGTTKSLYDVTTASRSAYNYVLEDEILLDYLLRYDNPEVYEKLGVNSLRDLYDNRKVMGRALFNELGEETFNALVDVGVFSKLPMNSEELYDHLLKRYKLPFEGLDELIQTDWVQASNVYRNELEKAAKESGMLWQMTKSAYDEGWGVTAREVRQNPTAYKEFVPLFGSNGLVGDSVAEHFGLEFNARKQLGNVLGDSEFPEVYVHPIAADLYQSMSELSTSPHKLGMVARVFQWNKRLWSSMVLGTSGFLFRQTYAQISQMFAAGGDLIQFLPDLTRLTVAYSVGLENVLDKTKRIYHGMTELELYREAVKTGLLNDYVPILGSTTTKGYSAVNPLNAKRQARYLYDTITQYKDWQKTLEQAGSLINNAVVNKAAMPFAFWNNHAENVAKFNTLRTLMLDNPFQQSGSFSTRAMQNLSKGVQGNFRGFSTVQEASKHIGRYFFFYDDVGQADKFIAQYVIPFWNWRKRNLPAQIRFAIKSPSRFVAYNRLYAATNAPMAQEGEELPEGGIPGWLLRSQPLIWKSEEGEYFGLPMTGVDPIADATSNFTQNTDALLRSFGIWKDNTQPIGTDAKLDELPWEKHKTNNFLRNLMQDVYPQYRAALQTITEEDLRTGRSLKDDEFSRRQTSFLGVEIHPITRMWLETLVPALGRVNKANPWRVFGQQAIQDPQTGEIIREERESIWGASRSDFDVEYPRFIKTLRFIGLNASPIDVAYNMGRTETDIQFALRDGEKAVRTLRQKLQGETNAEKKRKLEQQIDDVFLSVLALQMDYRAVYKWRRARGLKPRKALEYLKRRNTRISELKEEVLTTEEQYEVIGDVLRRTRP